MKPQADFCQTQKMTRTTAHHSLRFVVLILLIGMGTLGATAQTVSWSDSFEQGQPATFEHCQKWTGFLDQLSGNKFVSVKFWGSADPVGKTFTNPAAATELARLLSSRTPGVVTVNGENWVVTTCGTSSCGTQSVALSWNGSVDDCLCEDQYAIKPHTEGPFWRGGLKSNTCNAPSQDIYLEFVSGVSVTADGPTAFCKGENVTLTANASICQGGPYTYLWSNNATTPSIDVKESGDYYVTVFGPDLACNGISETVHVTVTDINVVIKEQAPTVCDVPVTLTAVGTSTGGTAPIVNKYCLFDIGDSNCTFTDNICSDRNRKVLNESFTQILPSAKPSEIIVSLYYGLVAGEAKFSFYINGQWIESFTETDAPISCFTGVQYPRTFSFSQEDLDGWDLSAEKTVTVEVAPIEGEVYFAGIVVETEMPGEMYSWSPTNTLLSSPLAASVFAKPSTDQEYTVTYTDATGCKATASVLVAVKCADLPCLEVTVPIVANCEVAIDPETLYNGTAPEDMDFVAEPPGPYTLGVHDVKIIGTLNGVTTSCLTRITVTDNVAPTITLNDISVLNMPGQCYAIVDLLDPDYIPTISDNCALDTENPLTKDKADEIFTGVTVVTWTVTDLKGNTQTAKQTITVINAAPIIASVVASAPSVAVNLPVTLTATHNDDNVSAAVIEWGDDSSPETVANPEKLFAVSHAYSTSGSYSVKITLTDACGLQDYKYLSVVVFNQLGASVSGSGWFDSPKGAYLRDPRAAGKAKFAFDAAIKSYSMVPLGSATFNFKAGNLKFRSTEYQWLVVDGNSAILKAYGKMNNKSGYEILISMAEKSQNDNDISNNKKGKGNTKPPKESDRIRVKIWDPSGVVIYDTQLGSSDDAVATTQIGGGSIEIEDGKSTFSNTYESPVASSFGEESTSAYPNPFEDWMQVQFNSGSQENVVIELLDLSGKVVFNQVFPVSDDGSYSLELPENTKDQPGVYILTIKQGKRVKILRVVRN